MPRQLVGSSLRRQLPGSGSAVGWRAALGCLVAVGLVSCGPSAEQQEARQVVALIDRVRSSAPEQRAPHLEALEKMSIRGQVAGEARLRCAAAYRALREGNLLASKARRALSFPSPPPGALQDLRTAEEKIEEATAAMPRCNEAAAALRRLARR